MSGGSLSMSRRSIMGAGAAAAALGLTGCSPIPMPQLPTPPTPSPTGSPSPAGGQVIATDEGTVTVEFITATTVRLRISPTGELGEIHSYSVEEPDAARPLVDSSQAGDVVTVSSAQLRLSVDRRRAAISIKTTAGKVVLDRAVFDLKAKDGPLSWTHSLAEKESCHGLGTRALSLDLRGKRVRLWNTDALSYYPDDDPLYLSIPFLLGVRDEVSYGLLWDNPARGWADLGADQEDRVTFTAEAGELRLYVIAGGDPAEVLRGYAGLTGRMDLPPIWAMGYHQSRWSYKTAQEFTTLARQFRTRQIPCDALYFDIDYMDGFRCFTWNKTAFPDPEGLLKSLHAQRFKTVAILDPGIKVDSTYDAFVQLREQKLAVPDTNGQPVAGRVWAGGSQFPDFTNPRARTWWAGRVAEMVGVGLDGVWNDMNEPSLFRERGEPIGKTMPDSALHDGDGTPVTHSGGGHNVYGMQMARATRDGLLAARPDRRPFNITRAGHAGVQRYATTWTGDNRSSWEHLRLVIPMVVNLGLSGVPFSGPDVGGFRGDPDAELFTRWIQLSSMLPFFRTHAANTSRPREPWSFGSITEGRVRQAIEWRYRLLPYLYSEAANAAETGLPIVRPLFFDEPADRDLRSVQDQFLLGESLLVTPVVQRGATSRSVRLPAGDWYDFWSGAKHAGGRVITVAAPMDRLPLFVRAGRTLPLWPVRQSTSDPVPTQLELRVYRGDGISIWYEDAGDGLAYLEGDSRRTSTGCRSTKDGLVLTRTSAGDYDHTYRQVTVQLFGLAPTARITVDGRKTQPMAASTTGAVTVVAKPFKRLEATGA